MRKSTLVASLLAFLILVPMVTTFVVRRSIAANFSSKEGRKATEDTVAGLVAMLGPEYSASSAPPLAQGLKVVFPSIKIQRLSHLWLEFTRTQLTFSIWPQLLMGKLGVRLELHDALTQAALDLSATPALGVALGWTNSAESPTTLSVKGRDLRLRTVFEALRINLVGIGPLVLAPDCCSAALNIAGEVNLVDKEHASASLDVVVRYPRVKLPRRMGELKFKDFALPLKYEGDSWLLARQVEVVTDDQSLTIGMTKASFSEPMQLRLQGTSPLVKIFAIAGGCIPGTTRSDAPVRLVWRTGQGWQCKG